MVSSIIQTYQWFSTRQSVKMGNPRSTLSSPPVRRLYICFFSSRRRHTRFKCDWSSDVCSSDLRAAVTLAARWARDELPRTHLDAAILLPEGGARESRYPRRDANGAPASYRAYLEN